MPEEELPLRERKKQRTRRQLVETASRLFAEQGYDATTIEQIAAEVEIAVQTLFTYFPSKDRLAMAAEWDLIEDLRRTLADEERAEDTLTVWRRYVETGATWAMRNRKAVVRGMLDAQDSPGLNKARLELPAAIEDALADGLARDYGTDAHSDLPTRLLATMLAYGNQTVTRHWVSNGGTGDLVAETVGVVDFAIDGFPRPGTPTRTARSTRRVRRPAP